ncbi:MAG TPA: hypothetical protein DDW52_22045 [Planctomycetaceae bacterium]|nr:hypothetical protein [Planctomycetaceae bacterium]
MISDPIERDEIEQAYLLHAMLHGLSTDAEHISSRIDAYLANEPDDVLDLAIVAYQDDSVVAPPDVVVQQWGMSRLYNVCDDGRGRRRHAVHSPWFDNGCSLNHAELSAPAHFWINCDLLDDLDPVSVAVWIRPGSRLSLRPRAKSTGVEHREIGTISELQSPASTCFGDLPPGTRCLALVDAIYDDCHSKTLKVLVVIAAASTPVKELTDYAVDAFFADRAKC